MQDRHVTGNGEKKRNRKYRTAKERDNRAGGGGGGANSWAAFCGMFLRERMLLQRQQQDSASRQTARIHAVTVQQKRLNVFFIVKLRIFAYVDFQHSFINYPGVYISVRKRYLFPPPPSKNYIFSPSRDTSFSNCHHGLFA